MRIAIVLVAACQTPVKAPVVAAPVKVAAPLVVADGSVTPALAMIVEGRVLVDPAVVKAVAVDAVLNAGQVTEADPECESDPPDYEKENDRYYRCREPQREQTWRAAGRSRTALAKATEWTKREVAVYGADGVLCDGVTTGESSLIGAWRSGAEAVLKGVDGKDPTAIAAAVLSHNAALVTTLTAPCEGIVVRDKRLPPLAMWTLAPADKELKALALAALDAHGVPEPHSWESPMPPSMLEHGEVKVEVARPASGQGHVLVIASRAITWCNGDPVLGGIWELADGTLHQLTLTWTDHDDGEFTPRLVADSDGNGWPEIVTTRGIHVGTEDGFAYTPWVRFDDVFNGPWCGD